MSKLKNTNILITGGAGFIGSHLSEELIKLGAIVTICDKNKPSDYLGKIKSIKGDLKNILSSNINLEMFDFIFHLSGSSDLRKATEHPLADLTENTYNTLLLLEKIKALKKRPRLIYFSSAAVLGSNLEKIVNESSLVDPESVYGLSKLAAENYISLYGRLYDLRAVIVRPFNVYGPGQRKLVIYDLISKINKRPKLLEVGGSGQESRDFIYIDDLISAVILIAQNGKYQGEIYHIASGKTVTINEVIKIICQVWQIRPKLKYLSGEPNSYHCWRVDIRKIRKLGFRPETSLRQGILDIKKWYENNNEKSFK